MKTMKKFEAFKKMVEKFGPWNTWSRSEHIAYGLARGVPYARMERCSNDNPPTYSVASDLWKIGAFEEHEAPPKDGKCRPVPGDVFKQVSDMIVWVKKEPRVKKPADEAAQ